MKRTKIIEKNNNYSLIEIGELSNISQYVYNLPNANSKIEGKVFVKDSLGLTSSEISFNTMQPNTSIPFIHKHKENEEIYIVIKGRGQMLLDDKVFDLKEGSIVRLSPDTERTIRNNSDNTFTYIVIQGKMNSINSNKINDGFGIEKKPIWKQ